MWMSSFVAAWALNGEFPQADECEWPNAITYGTWTGDVLEPDGATHEEVRSYCGAAWLGGGFFVTAAHCVEPEFDPGDGEFGNVIRFGNHTNNDDHFWE